MIHIENLEVGVSGNEKEIIEDLIGFYASVVKDKQLRFLNDTAMLILEKAAEEGINPTDYVSKRQNDYGKNQNFVPKDNKR